MTKYFLIILLFCSCNQRPNPFNPNDWYQERKERILSESNLPTDSTSIERYENGKAHKVKSFNHGHPTVEKWYRETGEQVVQTNYSRDGLFELRREICKDGKPLFEGIFYKGQGYGPSTWWRCGRSKEEEGVRFKDLKIGVWKYWDTSGKVSEADYKNGNIIDSLQWIKDVGD
jgi:antitoxin component YwqK of YwqJK toxin-antitoxin module